MGNLLRCEFFKLKKNLAVKIVTILAICYTLYMALMFLGIGKFGNVTIDSNDSAAMVFDDGGILSATMLFMMLPSLQTSLIAPFIYTPVYLIMLSVVVCSIIITDHQRGITRNLVMSGKSRAEVFFSKLIICLVYNYILFFIMALLAMLVNGMGFGWSKNVSAGKFIAHIGLLVLVTGGITSFLVWIATMTRHTGATIGISIATAGIFFFLDIIAGTGESLVVGTGGSEALATLFKAIAYVSELFVGTLLVAAANVYVSTSIIIKIIVVSVVTIGLTAGGGFLYFWKKDIK